MAFTVTVIMKSKGFDFTEFATGLVRFGKINATSVADMVNKVSHKAAGRAEKIDRLDIFAHGTSTYIKMGEDDVLHSFTPNKHASTLGKLKGLFATDGMVALNVCDVGQSESLITAIG